MSLTPVIHLNEMSAAAEWGVPTERTLDKKGESSVKNIESGSTFAGPKHNVIWQGT